MAVTQYKFNTSNGLWEQSVDSGVNWTQVQMSAAQLASGNIGSGRLPAGTVVWTLNGTLSLVPSSVAPANGFELTAASLPNTSNLMIFKAPSAWTGYYAVATLNNVVKLLINQDGFIGIGPTAPLDKLHVIDGHIRFSGSYPFKIKMGGDFSVFEATSSTLLTINAGGWTEVNLRGKVTIGDTAGNGYLKYQRSTSAGPSVRDFLSASIANDAVASLTQSGIASWTGYLQIHISGSAHTALFHIGNDGTTTLVSGYSATKWSNTATTATKVNVYWSAGNSRFEVENKTGSAIVVKGLMVYLDGQ